MKSIQIAEGKLARGPLPAMFSARHYEQVKAFHQSLAGYAPTPLIHLEALAKQLGIRAILVKDESQRFGLKAFKALGASYAVHQILAEMPDQKPVFVTTTDGNHGKGVAWAALQAGCRAEIFMPKGTVASRVEAIEALGNAQVTVTEWGYDETVRWTRDYAQRQGYILVQDTVLPGYHEIPQNIVLGYTTMIREVYQQLPSSIQPTHVFLQAGVGSMAGAVLGWLADTQKDQLPVTSIIEAADSACVFASCPRGELVSKAGITPTIMAGLNCGEVNPDIFPVLRDYASFYFACADEITEAGMRQYADPSDGDQAIVAGESGAVGLGLLMKLCQDASYAQMKQALGLDENSVVLLFNTEGATDPEDYLRVVGRPWIEVSG